MCMRGWNKKLIYKMVDFQASFLKPLSMLNGINRFQLVLTFYRDIKGSYYMLKSSGWGWSVYTVCIYRYKGTQTNTWWYTYRHLICYSSPHCVFVFSLLWCVGGCLALSLYNRMMNDLPWEFTSAVRAKKCSDEEDPWAMLTNFS